MKHYARTVAVTAALALTAAPALASRPDHQPPEVRDGGAQRGGHKPADDQYKDPFAPGRGNAYGRYCKGQSKKHVKGMQGTPFSQCVTAMAKLSRGEAKSPRRACKAEPRKRVKGMKGTPFSLCVKSGTQLVKDEQAQ